jgi:hypothetical protein
VPGELDGIAEPGVDWADSPRGLNEFEAKALEVSEERSALTARLDVKPSADPGRAGGRAVARPERRALLGAPCCGEKLPAVRARAPRVTTAGARLVTPSAKHPG